jgi:hypothetical protein
MVALLVHPKLLKLSLQQVDLALKLLILFSIFLDLLRAHVLHLLDLGLQLLKLLGHQV